MRRIDDIPDPVEGRIDTLGIERIYKQFIYFRHRGFQVLKLIQCVAVSGGNFFV